MIAPLIKPIRLQGGTFYTFSSASEDLGLSFNDSQKKFRFSKYALLNIPNIGNPANGENLMNFSNTPGGFSSIDNSKVLNDYLAESFQNYCLNLEATITSGATYDVNVDKTVSERIFYKWLKETGAIRFRNAIIGTEQAATSFGNLYVEEDESASYSRVIKQVGDINVLNTVRNNNNSFSEVYVYIPTSQGNTPVVLFNSVADSNYFAGQVFTNSPTNPANNEYINGRGPTTVHPAGLSIFAFFDSDTNTFTTPDPTNVNITANFYYFSPTTSAWIQNGNADFKWWYTNPIADSYYTESAFNDAATDRFKIESTNKTAEFRRSRLDGISAVFNTNAYAGISNAGASVIDFGTYNETAAAQTFDFNAVLVYYDLYNPTSGEISATNLFGILFLDNVDLLSTGGGYIPRLTKYKPNSFTGDNGNSFAFRINLKFDVNSQDTSVETSINDYNPYSMQLYMDALNKMVDSYNILLQNNAAVATLGSEVSQLKSLILTQTNLDEINKKIANIQTLIDENGLIYANNSNILTLIQRNYDEITNIYKNFTSVQMSYNIDVFAPGNGIFLDKTQAGGIKIVNTNQMFAIGQKPLVAISSDFTTNSSSRSYIHPLINYTNYLKITDGAVSTPYNADRDIIIYIDDSNFAWSAGQSMRFSFTYGLDMSNTNGNYNFIVYTDASDKLNTGFPYSAEVAYITYTDFEKHGNKPIIEIVCLNPTTYQFAVDIF